MNTRRQDDEVVTHEELVDYVSDLLTEWEWTVNREPRVGTVRPDLVAEAPDGTAYVVEIKTGGDAGHLGSLGQIETFRNALEAEIGREPDALLLLADDAPDGSCRLPTTWGSPSSKDSTTTVLRLQIS